MGGGALLSYYGKITFSYVHDMVLMCPPLIGSGSRIPQIKAHEIVPIPYWDVRLGS